jgi:hypothetical protein
MAIEFKRNRDLDHESEDDRRRREAEQTREQFGIATLTLDEELIDDETFSRMHDRLAIGRAAPQPDPDASAPADAATAAPAGEVDELVLEEIATVLPSPAAQTTPTVDAGPPTDPAAVADLERQLAAAKDRTGVAALALGIARYHADVAALFVVNKGLIAGLRGSGGGLEDRTEGIMIPVDAGSLMAAPIGSGRLVRSATPLGPVDMRVLRAMGREHVHHVAVLPIAIGDRVVNLLYVDNGRAPLAETSLGALRVLCLGVGRVYERLIVERKQSVRPPRGKRG